MKLSSSSPSVLSALWWLAATTLVALHFVHLQADFPNFSPWMDYAKYTDEGWYSNAAIRDALFGHWRLPGDFNPAVALPVWPLLARIAFAIGGVGLVPLRILGLLVFLGDLAVTHALLRRAGAGLWPARAAVLYLAASAYLWAFSRIAILEPLVMLLLMLGWWIALGLDNSQGRARTLRLAAIGLLLCAAVLTKTTTLFLLPSTVYLLWAAAGYRFRRLLSDALTVAAAAAIPWLAYYFLLVHPHYLADYHYLFTANLWDQPTTVSGWFWAFWYAAHGSLWAGPTLCGLTLAVVLLSPIARPVLWRQPLAPAAALCATGYILFTGWHNNPQPRYYETVLYPMVLIASLGAAALMERVRLLGVAAWAVLAIATLSSLRTTVGFIRHPEYTWLSAAHQLTAYIDAHPNGRRMLLSISGDDITLMTHLPAICDDFGPTDLAYRIHQYQPGWYAAWNELDDGTLEDLHTQYSLEPVAQFHAFDDEDRDVLVLYKLHPLPAAKVHYDVQGEQEANGPLD